MGRRGPVPGKRGPNPIRLPYADPPPRFLDREAKAEWKRVCGELGELNILERTDRAALSCYCVCWSRWRAAEEVLQEQGMTYTAESGLQKLRPEVRIAETALAQLRLFLSQFGLTPEARQRMHLDQPDEPEDDFERFIGGNSAG